VTIPIKAKPMGDFTGGAGIAHLDGTCRVCGKLVSRGCRYCNRHKWIAIKAKEQVARLCELAEQRRVRQMVHEWWEAG